MADEKSSESVEEYSNDADSNSIVDDSGEESYDVPDDEKTPFVILLGYLGAGKTTLINYILKDQQDLRICVIENEFGAVAIDDDLVSENVRESEDIIALDNGCLCCTVRGDLIKTLLGFEERRKVFDFILLETTGLADPSPIVSTFNQNPFIGQMFRIDSIICVVDSKHIGMQLSREPDPGDQGKVNEAAQQIAFADRILLNKTDLITSEELKEVKKQISSVNMFAEIIETQNSRAPIKQLLGLSSFNLERTLELLESEIEAENLTKEIDNGHSHVHNHDTDCSDCEKKCSSPSSCCSTNHDHDHDHDAVLGEKRKSDGNLTKDKTQAKKLHTETQKVVSTRHNNKVGSIALILEGSFNVERFNALMGELLDTKAEDIYRCKGVLSFDGEPNKFVFQGVHEQIVCEPSSHLWDDALTLPDKTASPRINKIVFIGYNLDKDFIEAGLRKALVNAVQT